MRLGLVILLSLLMTGCALWRKDKDEPVENRSDREKTEPVLRPSEALKPDLKEIASPITDHFYMRGSYYQAAVASQLRISSTGALPGSLDGDLVSLEEDYGLDDVIDQARLEFDFRLRNRNHLRVDYFKMNRFGEVLAREDVQIGDFDVQVGDRIRTKFDWRVLSLTYTYSLFKSDRFEAGVGIGAHIVETQYEISEPGTLSREQLSDANPFGTIAVNGAFRISTRWSVTGRAQTFTLNKRRKEGHEATMQDFHGDIQYRWRRNFAVGLGYTKLYAEFIADTDDQPFEFNMDTSGPELFFRASF
jgi:hypothetical protein